MSAPELRSGTNLNPVDTPLYTPWEAARYLRAPVWIVHGLCFDRPPPDPAWCMEWYLRRHGPFALWGDDSGRQDGPGRLSFRQFADLYVRYSAAKGLLESAADGDRNEAQTARPRQAAWHLVAAQGLRPLLLGETDPATAVPQLVDSCGHILGLEQRHWLEEQLRLGLSRVERGEAGDPVLLYPFSRWPSAGSPRLVVLDPRVRFGRPTLARRGIPTDILFGRHQAGDSIATLVEDYGLPAEEVEEAIRYEAAPGEPGLPF